MALQILFTIIAIFLISVVLFYKWRFSFWKKRNVYTVEPKVPFGNLIRVLFRKISLTKHFQNMYKEVRSKGLRYAGFLTFLEPTLFVVDLDLIKNILVKDFQHFTDHTIYVNEEADPLTGHLFALKGAKWKALRHKLTPTFTSGKLKMMSETLIDCTKYLPAIIDDCIAKSEPIDIKEIFARYATDVIGSVAFGIDCNCLQNPDTEFRKYGKRVFAPGFVQGIKNLLSLFIPNVLRYFNVSITDREIQTFFINIVRETVEYRESHDVERKDFMKLLIELKNQKISVESKDPMNSNGEVIYSQNGLSLNEIAAQAFVFFIAGFETSSTTLTFCMLELAIHTEIQDKLRGEVNDVLKRYGGKITYDAVMEMDYLDKCVQETLRKYPPGSAISRECTIPYQISGSDLELPKGAPVFISVYGIHHDSEYYPEPDKFDPERFSEENKAKRHPFAYLPFGEGPRICIGMRFGILQVKIGIIALLKNYVFTINEKTQIPIEFDPAQLIISVKGGVLLNCKKVEN